MTINELIERLNSMPGVHGDLTVKVRAMAGMRSSTPIVGVSVGFDWDMGSIVLEPSIPLTIKGYREAGKEAVGGPT